MGDLVRRIDSGKMGRAIKTDAGFLRVPAHIARTGVLTYKQPDGTTRRELRLPSEVFHADSLDTLKQLPVTLDHPPTETGLLDADTAPRYTVGSVGEDIRQDENKIAANLMVTDAKAISAIDSGKRQVSAGYTTELDFTPGIYAGEHYDAIQKNIRYNHVAIVQTGRAGPDVRLHIDSAIEVQMSMEMIKINGVDFEVTPQVAQAIAAERSAQVELTKKIDAETARADSAEASLNKKDQELVAAKDPSRIANAVSARLGLERQATAILPAVKLDGLSDVEVKKAVIEYVNPKMKDALANASVDYIGAAFDFAVNSFKPNEALDAVRQSVQSDVKLDSNQIRAKFIAEQKDAWKKPLGKE